MSQCNAMSSKSIFDKNACLNAILGYSFLSLSVTNTGCCLLFSSPFRHKVISYKKWLKCFVMSPQLPVILAVVIISRPALAQDLMRAVDSTKRAINCFLITMPHRCLAFNQGTTMSNLQPNITKTILKPGFTVDFT